MRTLKVTGDAELSLPPDQITVNMTLNGWDKSYEKTVSISNEHTSIIKDSIEACGFNKKDLRSTSYHINPKYEYYQDNKGTSKNKLIGYEFNHSLSLSFDLDKEKLYQLLDIVSRLEINPSISFNFSIKDLAEAKNSLLRKAVEDSTRKAEVIANAASLHLGEIQNINYSWDNSHTPIVYYDMHSPRNMLKSASKESLDIDPENIKISDRINVEWEIN